MRLDAISICTILFIVFRRAKAGRPANWPTGGARAGARVLTLIGQLITLIYHSICGVLA